MTSSIWRFAHLVLALLASLVLIIASITGAVLAFDTASEKTNEFRVHNFDDITLHQFIPQLKKLYPEITHLAVDHNQFVSLEGFDQDGNEVKAYIDPITGKVLGQVSEKSEFIKWNIALHRSLFLHETGRFIVGLASFLFFLIIVSGTMLLIKRQNGIKNFFSKVKSDSFFQYFHVFTGRLMLVPVLIIALTGTYLFLIRFEVVPNKKSSPIEIAENTRLATISVSEFPIFQKTKLSEVAKIEFPFIDDDPEEFFLLKLKDKELKINQFTGQIVQETKYPFTQIAEKFTFDLHTGQTHWIWAVILLLASVNILFFIYSGFAITWKRIKIKVKNKFKPQDCEYILLVGSENGTSLGFANHVHNQLQSNGKKSFLTEMNDFSQFPKAKKLVIFTSTYGLGEAPSNATKFEKLVSQFPQKQTIDFSVVGFGSKSYPDFCAFAIHVDELLSQQSWANKGLPLHTVNDKSPEEFTQWVSNWSTLNELAMATTPSLYAQQLPKLTKFTVVDKAEVVCDQITTFRINLKPSGLQKFKSGDLLAIYPLNNSVERFYSIGKVNKSIQLIVRLHPMGLGSGFLHDLNVGKKIKARIIKNPQFYFPKKATQVALISNGTGIAPFLGMLDENKHHIETHLYAGFRKLNALTKRYVEITDEFKKESKLTTFNLAISREEVPQYVMNLIKRDQDFFLNLLQNQGVIMICGSLKMQKDVEIILSEICKNNDEDYARFKENGQILTDCY